MRVTPRPWLWRPRTKPIRIIEIHATRGNTTPEKQMQASLYWVQSARNVGNIKADGSPDYENPEWGSSFSHVIGTGGSLGTVLDDDQMPTYSAGYGGPGSEWAIDEYGISYELAQSAAQEPFTEACLARAAKEVGAKCRQHGIPPVFLTIPRQVGEVPTGLVRHDRCQNGYVLGKTDPGDQFNEAHFLALVRAEMEVDDMALTLEQRVAAHEQWHRETLDPWMKNRSDRILQLEQARESIVKEIAALQRQVAALKPSGDRTHDHTIPAGRTGKS